VTFRLVLLAFAVEAANASARAGSAVGITEARTRSGKANLANFIAADHPCQEYNDDDVVRQQKNRPVLVENSLPQRRFAFVNSSEF
jgi:hypothetical protein